MEKIDFSKVAASVSSELEDNYIQKVTLKSSIISAEEFYVNFNSELLQKIGRIPVSEQETSIEDFAAIFKSFEDYPENIRPKKAAVSKEFSRLNVTISKNSTFAAGTENTILHGDDPSCSAPQLLTNFGDLEDRETAMNIYKKYEQFKINLDKLMERAQHRVVFAAQYATKLQQINIFAQQLEKLLPSQSMGKQAFSEEEENKLKMIVADMKRLCYLQNNQDVFNNINCDNLETNSNSQRLEGLVEVLTHSLISISCYNDN